MSDSHVTERNEKQGSGVGGGDMKTKKTRPTSNATIKVEQRSASSLFGRSDQEGAECERKGSAECFGPVF